jgi:hypothetical protein
MRFAVLIVLTAAAAPAGLASASVHFVSQDNVLNLHFTDPNFSDAHIDGANTIASTADAPGDSVPIGWGYYFTPLTNQYVTTTGGVTIDGISIAGGMSYTVHHPTGAPGAHTYHYTRTQPDGPVFTTIVAGGLTHLHFGSGSSPMVQAGGPFTWTLTAPGDWSSHGTSPGQSQIVSIGADWSITQDFVFDGTATTFAMSRAAGSASNVSISLNLYAVPGPGGLACLAMGLACLRRRR